MGVGTHIDFNGFELITRETAYYSGAGSESYGITEGDYMGKEQFGTYSASYSWEYLSNVGFSYHGLADTSLVNFILYFSDEDNDPHFLEKKTTSVTNSNLAIASTTTYEASTEYTFLPSETISTSWSDKTTSNITRNRSYTTISATSSVSYSIGDGGAYEPFISCQKTNSLALVFQPHIGTEWTADGSRLTYYQLFTSTGAYSNTYSNLILDRDFETTIYAVTTALAADTSSQQGSTISLTYAYTSNAGENISITNAQVETFINNQMYLTTTADETIVFSKVVTASSSLSYIIKEEFTETAETGSVIALTTQRITAIKTTATHYIVDNMYTYNSFFTYSGLIDTTSMYSYVLFSQSCGTHLSTYEYDTTSGAESDPQPATSTQSEYTTMPTLTNTYLVSYYPVLLGTTKSEWNKFYYQNYPVNRFAIAFTSDSAQRYMQTLQSGNGIILTSYKFDILNDFYVNPKMYVPITYEKVKL
jgi:hypothetical protein